MLQFSTPIWYTENIESRDVAGNCDMTNRVSDAKKKNKKRSRVKADSPLNCVPANYVYKKNSMRANKIVKIQIININSESEEVSMEVQYIPEDSYDDLYRSIEHLISKISEKISTDFI